MYTQSISTGGKTKRSCQVQNKCSLQRHYKQMLGYNSKHDSHLIWYGRNVVAEFSLQPQDTILFLVHLAVESVVPLRIIRPEPSNTIYLTQGTSFPAPLLTEHTVPWLTLGSLKNKTKRGTDKKEHVCSLQVMLFLKPQWLLSIKSCSRGTEKVFSLLS